MTVYVCSSKTLMAITDQQCGTGVILAMETEAKLLQAVLKLRQTSICSSPVRTYPHETGHDEEGRGKKGK